MQASHSAAPRLALIGCGAFAELFYLPGLAHWPDVMARLILVDRDADRAGKLAARFHAAECQTGYAAVLDRVDGVIVAAPHALHYPITMAYLARGVPVLCEKPLTLSSAEAHEMVEAARVGGVPLATNHTQRLFPANQKIRELLAAGALGELRSISYAWGAEFTWPTVSGFYFQPTQGKRHGVLVDRGPHALDLICWWLGAKPRLVASENDALGGLDAVAHVTLAHGDCTIDVRLSWLSKLSNSYALRGSRASIHNSFEAWWAVPLRYADGRAETLALPCDEREYSDFAPQVIGNFIEVIQRGAAPLIPAADVLPSVELVEECYAQAVPFDAPWQQVEGVLDER